MESAALVGVLLVAIILFQCMSDGDAGPARFLARTAKQDNLGPVLGNPRESPCTPGCVCVHEI